MYLKSIEVQGFKSFANKLTFEFHNGITGIVGPNGSGKSNIADAVRWVLGEQSAKQLRGGKMEDVIFAGTELRKPVSYASVAITIDNSDKALAIDYDTVTITRKVFRSGESEYLINGTACRLRDINELFYDTGIGKEGYSIIGQGQIDRILSGKPEERRELFDEAAGIVKFKRRKTAAQKKLDEESQHLVRVNDILAELEKQVGPLERQAEKAKQYLNFKEDLKKNEVNLFLLESEEIKAELSEFEKKYSIAETELNSAKAEFEKSRETYEANEQILSELNSIIEEYTSKGNQAEIDKNKLANQIELLTEQIKSVLVNDEHLNNRLDAINEMLKEREEEKSKLVSERFLVTEKLDEIKFKTDKSDSDVLETTKLIETYRNDIETAKNDIFDNLNEKSQIKTKLQRNETLIEQINIRKSALTRELINCKSEEDSQSERLSGLKSNLEAITKSINDVSSAIADNDKKLLSLRDEISRLNNDINNTNRSIISDTSKLESLVNIAERYDGYGMSIKKVMEKKDEVKGILGVVADIIKTEPKYETAIETALGGSIQNIVTDTESTAKELITYLKEGRFGRATFLPLSAITAKNINTDNLPKEKGVIGYANSLVKADKQYNELCKYLLGRIIVVDNIDNALYIARKYQHTLRIVTLEGEQLNPGGSMAGGSYKNSSNLLGRRREIESLKKIIEDNNKILGGVNAKLVSLKDKQTKLREDNDALKIELSDKQIEQNTANMLFNQADARQKELTLAYSNSKREQEEIENQLLAINGEVSASKLALSEADNKDKALTDKVSELTELIEKANVDLAKKQDDAQKLHIELAKVTADNDYAEENVKRVLREISHLKEELETINDNIGSSDAEIAEKKDNIAKIEESIKAAQEYIVEYEGIVAKAKEERLEATDEQKKLFSLREEMSSNINSLDKECLRLSQRIDKVKEARDGKIDYMWNEYELTLIRAAELKDPDLSDSSELRKNINDIKNDIRKLGDVNVNAIEDFKEVSERYTFLKTQHDDLIAARDSLIGIIDELDTGMRKQFIEKFQEIKVEFDKVFKELFGGGRGTIELEEDVDILEAGIKIISQPPGKKLQNMMQLSGGEKALTAIALLFAIQNLKPSPFCLLDEIEAALDDSNVGRYANYLHKLTKNTQFIVITHRRGTMAAADRLYGITMQEKGVSTLVSVDLIKDQLDEKKEKE